MPFQLPRPTITKTRIWLARYIAVSADAMQLFLFPVFGEGFLSPLNAALDIFLCITLSILLGFRMWFLPSFLLEGLPLIDIAPTWTIAVLLATRSGPDENPLPPVIEDYNSAR